MKQNAARRAPLAAKAALIATHARHRGHKVIGEQPIERGTAPNTQGTTAKLSSASGMKARRVETLELAQGA